MKKNILIRLAILVLFVSSLPLILKVSATDIVEPNFSTVTSSPYPLVAYSGNPVLTRSMVTDRNANFVADPFLFRGNNVWYMFFEVETDQYGEEIGVANSTDGFHWTYMQIVLSDSQFRLSFPQVYEDNGTYYMVPDCDSDSVRLYTTTNFPYGWTFVSTLVTDAQRPVNPWGGFADPSLFYFNGYWWMFVSDWSNSNCYLYYSQSLTSGWVQHPMSPIVSKDASRARPAGRTILYNGGVILRFVQKCDVSYGEEVRAYQVDTLTTTNFAEHEIPESPLLSASGTGWNAQAMHTFGLWWTGTNWIVSTDGVGTTSYNGNSWTVGIYTTQEQTPAPTTYILTLSQSTGGTITSPKTTYNSGETAAVTASASSGYSFNNWLVDGARPAAPYDTNNPLSLVMNANHTVQAVFTGSSPPQNASYVLGNVNVESGENWWGGQYDACKFQWTQPTGTYTGSISVYISHIASTPDNRMVVAVYDASTNPLLIAGSAEKTGLTVGWNTQTLTGTFTLTQGAWYWLYVQSPSGNTNGRMTTGSIAGQHGWGDKTYDGTVPQTLSLQGTEQTRCSIYANMTQEQTPPQNSS
jgi:hypothetical protein